MIITKQEFEAKIKQKLDVKDYLNILKDNDQYTDFEEIHGIEFAHGQYDRETRGEMLIDYIVDHYLYCKFDNYWVSQSIVFLRVKKYPLTNKVDKVVNEVK